MNYAQFCDKCQHRSFNIKTGILCGLTNEKPAFENECDNFLLDEKRAQELEQKATRQFVNERPTAGDAIRKDTGFALLNISRLLGLLVLYS